MKKVCSFSFTQVGSVEEDFQPLTPVRSHEEGFQSVILVRSHEEGFQSFSRSDEVYSVSRSLW